MKKLLLLLAILLVSCDKEEPIPFQISNTSYYVKSLGGIVKVCVQTKTDLDITIECPQWVKQIDGQQAKSDTIFFVCNPNTTIEKRSSKITFTPSSHRGNYSQTITITQGAFQDQEPKITSFIFEAKNNLKYLLADVVANIDDNGTITALIPYKMESKN